jgi:hypothetical protein
MSKNNNYVYISRNLINLLENKKRQVKRGNKSFRYHYYYFCSTIITQFSTNKQDENEFVPVSSSILQKVISRSEYLKIKNNLIEWNVIETSGTWTRKQNCIGYRLTPMYQQEIIKVKIQDDLMNVKIDSFRQEKLSSIQKLSFPHQALYENLKKLEIHTSDANTYNFEKYATNNLKKYNSNSVLIVKLTASELFYQVDKFGHRAHTNLTNISNDLRKFLHVEKSNLVQTDITNSQPLFFYLVIRNINQIPEAEKNLYKELVEKGMFYEFFMGKLDTPANERDKTKTRVLSSIFFDRYRTKEDKYIRVFKESFPNIFEFINVLKKKDHKLLSQKLQREESNFIFNKVVPGWMKKYPEKWILTLHDSFVVKEDDVQHANNCLLYYFRKMGIEPKIKIKYFIDKEVEV